MMLTDTSSEPILSAEAAIRALQGTDNQLRYYAAWWLGKYQISESFSVLCDALEDEGYRTEAGGYPLRRQAARTLGLLKNPLAVPALLRTVRVEGDLSLREAVIQALAAIGEGSCIPTLVELLDSPETQPWEALIEALGTFRVGEVQEKIRPFLDHDSQRVQCGAARYFYLVTQEESYLERIIANLNHSNAYIRWAAAFDLGAIGHVQACTAILKAKIGNSLKLLNLKRILEVQLGDDLSPSENEESIQFLLDAIAQLLIEL